MSTFWSLQITGWSLFAIAQMVSFWIQNYPMTKGIPLAMLFALFGLAITLVMRKIYTSTRFRSLSPWTLTLSCTGVCIVSAICFVQAIYLTFALLDRLLLSGKTKLSVAHNVDHILTNYFQLLPILLIWTLLYYAIKYLHRANKSDVEVLRLSASLKEAELNALKGQINPHFMFNCLNNIRGLMLEDVTAARAAISSLAEVLRHSLSGTHKDKIPLRKELLLVNEFIALAKLHYENRLIVSMQIDPQSEPCLIPVMLLQLLVENAIKHGIANEPGGGELVITTKISKKRLEILVTNPGKLDTKQHITDNPNSTGTGLLNITERLLLMYATHASFSLQQQQDLIEARVWLPVEYETCE
ncbi:histidine kinase [Aestuariibacter halophilus]|uniref:Histidine kinase n=1 Tax=Fluctibacter halophilus TaxID=226011 RepID=A0ABS8G364_9ALTE|nr:histidine kinase [Aestuariibacter halophilus]MCC2614968.1 histidine kinase [Aestuariibacter halophilus]